MPTRPDFSKISDAVKKAAEDCKNPTPFTDHIAFFRHPDQTINCDSIASQWRLLTGQNRLVTWLKSKITMDIANFNRPQGCPFVKSFQNATEMMPYSLHPCDTGVVQKDGSIHISNLLVFLERCCEMTDTNQIYLRKCKVDEFTAIQETKEPPFSRFISWHTVAKNEWKEAFTLWQDFDLNGDPCMWLSTVLQFYFEPQALFQRTLKNQASENKTSV